MHLQEAIRCYSDKHSLALYKDLDTQKNVPYVYIIGIIITRIKPSSEVILSFC